MSNETFQHPIIGQEAVCRDGLGRVIAFCDNFPDRWIQVSTYVNDRQCRWDPENVTLIPLRHDVGSHDDLYVLVAERDDSKVDPSNVSIAFEQRLDQAGLNDIKARREQIGDRYGKTRIARLVFVDD